MKVTIINTADAGGGAPAACTRLLKALLSQGVDANMLVQYKKTDNAAVTGLVNSKLSKWKAQYTFFAERIPFMFFHEKDETVRFAFSTANAGTSIADHPLVKQADILHLHWTNSGFLSINDLKALINTGKPIVWTMHDMWTFTGGCHYSGDCDGYRTKCGNCPLLRDADEDDLSRMGWLRKDAMYARADNITFVGCSNWLAGVAKTSSLLNRFNIINIPNPIDVDVFSPFDKQSLRAKYGVSSNAKIVLFGAANINDKRKGIKYLVEALQLLKQNQNSENIEVVIFGKNKHFDVSTLPFKVHQLNIINQESILAEVYSMADTFVTTSIEDNLPNMVMEAMACGTPVVAFETGGIPEMVDHLQNGYLAPLKSAQGIADGIRHVLFSGDADTLSKSARQKVLDNYNNSAIANQYNQLYQSVLQA
ncbi:glycosyltransferase family 4 protein [Mucilaginibacter auburnensis]|uniref:Glycosyltransferase involved in cell wall biosynthesis n=1 Tax=Mucilaginibacter auburnensis TaxID=1457233 RepID=A0A2H9VSH3_9SPHI|nr:glycosyltransferase family 4 protein [Mucilaginibacter auburnensis]PJJ83776.1 glycosyltransferase involved in cell wall biosynthesis [Mucilaginibacter auburnensis]